MARYLKVICLVVVLICVSVNLMSCNEESLKDEVLSETIGDNNTTSEDYLKDSHDEIAKLILDGKYPEARRGIIKKVQKLTDAELDEDEELRTLSFYLSALESLDEDRDRAARWLMRTPYNYKGILSDEILNFRDKVLNEEEKRELNEEYAHQLIEDINKKHNKNNTSSSDKGVKIGMTKEEVLSSNWGSPKDINRTTTRYGTNEQWVYENGNFLYFEDDILTAIQN